MAKVAVKMKKRAIYLTCIFFAIMVLLNFRVGWIQVVKGDDYAAKAVTQQTKDVMLPAKRGAIYDAKGNSLAISYPCYTIWARPALVKNGKTQKEKRANLKKTSKKLAKLLGTNEKAVRKKLSGNESLVKIKKYQTKSMADKIRKADITGVEVVQGVKRYYPMNETASQLLGNVSDDNAGLAGLEMEYNSILSGIKGRQTHVTDPEGKPLIYGDNAYQEAEDGLDIVTTIDIGLQSRVEEIIQEAKAKTNADKVMCLMMNPKTGEILTCATTENYNPNSARQPLDQFEQNKLSQMSEADQFKYLNQMWRNPLISDTYAPGSTFKLLTLAAALEEGKATPDTWVNCRGVYRIGKTTLKCWRYKDPHGRETLTEAVSNSCNPVFINQGKQLGVKTLYNYMDLFGITEKTGIDFPGEASPIISDSKDLNSVVFATMSYGQGMSVTPLQMLSAISAIGNDGQLLEPRLVKEVRTTDGKTVKRFDKKIVRQVISKETADEIKDIMEFTVEKGGGKAAKVKGYVTGGKTGTSENEVRQGTWYASFAGLAPIDDPELATLLIIDNPRSKEVTGGQISAPVVKEIHEYALPYLNIK